MNYTNEIVKISNFPFEWSREQYNNKTWMLRSSLFTLTTQEIKPLEWYEICLCFYSFLSQNKAVLFKSKCFVLCFLFQSHPSLSIISFFDLLTSIDCRHLMTYDQSRFFFGFDFPGFLFDFALHYFIHLLGPEI